jgi:hypothetical protein
MTAQLTLVGDPLAATDAADKHYVDSIGSVRYDIAQSLSGGQQAQAQANMGLGHDIQSGTVMLFYQAAAPTGWTKLTTQNDKALRVVSGSGGVAGGTNPFSTVMAQAATGNHTLSRAELPSGILSNATQTITVYPSGNPSNYLPRDGWADRDVVQVACSQSGVAGFGEHNLDILCAEHPSRVEQHDRRRAQSPDHDGHPILRRDPVLEELRLNHASAARDRRSNLPAASERREHRVSRLSLVDADRRQEPAE